MGLGAEVPLKADWFNGSEGVKLQCDCGALQSPNANSHGFCSYLLKVGSGEGSFGI